MERHRAPHLIARTQRAGGRRAERSLLTLLLVAGITVLPAAEGCPITTNPGGGSGTASSGAELDIGGSQGAMWTVSFAPQTRVTVRGADGTASADVDLAGTGWVEVLDRSLQLSSFCWRSDVVCPQQLLALQTAVLQPSADQVLISYTPKGPLLGLGQAGLAGQLQGSELAVPLPVGGTQAAPCQLVSGSAVYATAYEDSATEGQAVQMQGQVTVRYGGECVVLGGDGSFVATDVLELSTQFTASRQ